MHIYVKKIYFSILVCAIATICNTPYLKAADKESKLPSFTVTSNGSFWDELKKDKILTRCVIPITATSVLLALYSEEYKPLCKKTIQCIAIGYTCDRFITAMHEALGHATVAYLCGSDIKEIYVSAHFFGPGHIRRLRNESVSKETQLKQQFGISIAGPLAGLATATYLGFCIKNSDIEKIPHNMLQCLIGNQLFIQLYNLTPQEKNPTFDGSKALESFATLEHITTKSSVSLADYKKMYYKKIPSQEFLTGTFLLTTFLYPIAMAK